MLEIVKIKLLDYLIWSEIELTSGTDDKLEIRRYNEVVKEVEDKLKKIFLKSNVKNAS